MIKLLGAGWVQFIFDQAVEAPVYLVGDFSNWDESVHRMNHQPDGTHEITLRLRPGSYLFKYRAGPAWFNDHQAHAYSRNFWGSENSVVMVPDDGQSSGLGHRTWEEAAPGPEL